MSFRSKLAYYLRVIARYADDPSQLAMRRYYFIPEMYAAFKRPWLQALRLATVIDVGASVGDFAFTVRPLIPQAQIYSFEPLPDCYAAMLQHMRGAARFQAFNLALGDQAGELTFYRSSHAPSSSFLPMAQAHKGAFPTAADARPVTVKMERLDTVAAHIAITDPLLVKIDVQGYEGHVLAGGEQTIRRAALVIVETSFLPLYAGQPLFADVYRLLTSWGFTYAGALAQLPHPEDGRLMQEDSLFINRGQVG
jgi:FkbM family methyltransferase